MARSGKRRAWRKKHRAQGTGHRVIKTKDKSHKTKGVTGNHLYTLISFAVGDKDLLNRISPICFIPRRG
jgi:hypothetical protein